MEVKWSPNHDDKFYTFGTNLALYKINDIPDDNSSWKEGGECSRYFLNNHSSDAYTLTRLQCLSMCLDYSCKINALTCNN